MQDRTPTEHGAAELLRVIGSLLFKTTTLCSRLERGFALERTFDRMILAQIARKAVRFNAFMLSCLGNPEGIEHRQEMRDQWAFLLSDASRQGAWRIQIFDKRHFVSHHTYTSKEEAIEQMVSDGYVVADPGALDRLSSQREWTIGGQVSELMQQHAQGDLSWADCCEAMATAQGLAA